MGASAANKPPDAAVNAPDEESRGLGLPDPRPRLPRNIVFPRVLIVCES